MVAAVAQGHGWEDLKGRTVTVLSSPEATLDTEPEKSLGAQHTARVPRKQAGSGRGMMLDVWACHLAPTKQAPIGVRSLADQLGSQSRQEERVWVGSQALEGMRGAPHEGLREPSGYPGWVWVYSPGTDEG